MRGMLTRIAIIPPSVVQFLCNFPKMLQIDTSVTPEKFLEVGQTVVKLFKKCLGGYFLFPQSVHVYIYIYRVRIKKVAP